MKMAPAKGIVFSARIHGGAGVTGQDDEPVFVGADVPGESAETAARIAETANALVTAAGGRLNPVELAGIARWRLEESVRREVLPALEAPPACCRGCSWCCHSAVRASIAEAVAVAVYVLTAKSAAEREEIRRRLDAYVGEAAGLTAEERLTSKRPCPFLEREECTVYPARPMICAGFLSPTPEACERAATGRGEVTFTVRGALEQAGLLCHALARMFGAFGLEAEPVDLAEAVKIILDDPTSVDRWRTGEKVFSAVFIGRLTGGTAPQDEDERGQWDRALPALLEELERRAGPGAAASIREAWERWRRDGPQAKMTFPALMPRS
jgi:Fe-S-cluster containining protein